MYCVLVSTHCLRRVSTKKGGDFFPPSSHIIRYKYIPFIYIFFFVEKGEKTFYFRSLAQFQFPPHRGGIKKPHLFFFHEITQKEGGSP